MKKVLMIIAFQDFKDEEYFIPKQILEGQGISVKTASTEKGIAVGVEGGEVKVDLLIEEINDFDGIILVGGPGCLKFLDTEQVRELVKKAFFKQKLIGAICIAPVILAKSGILKEKEATVWSSSLDKSGVKALEENKAIYESEFSVVQDDNIITASGPEAAKEFGKAIIENL